MKNKILLLIILLLIPTFVYAKDTCNDNDIKIKSITLKELNGFSEEIQDSSINNNTINLNLKMYDVGDSSTYDITVENTSNEDYYFTKDSMKLENDYLEYSLKNDSETIPAKDEKTIELKVSYKNQIPDNNYSDTSKLIISLSDKPLENPKTNISHNYLILIILLIVITIYVEVRNKSLNKKKLLLMISLLSTIPISINALCTVNLNVETKIEIENKEAIFLSGTEVNIKMKELAGDDTSTQANGIFFNDTKIKAIKYSNHEPIDSNKEEKNIVSTSDSPYPIYMWYEDNTISWWSEDSHPSLNEDATFMFGYLLELIDIDSLEKFDTSNTTTMDSMFNYDISLTSLSKLENWNTAKLINLDFAFSSMTALRNVNGLENWDTSKVTSMRSVFAFNTLLESIKGLENWDVSKVKKMSLLFTNDFALSDVSPIQNWDVSNVDDISYIFSSCASLEEINLEKWETPNLKSAGYMFAMLNRADGPTEGVLKRIKLSEKFDTSKVTNMDCMFFNLSVLEDYEFLKYINTKEVTSMHKMLFSNDNLFDTEYMKNWDVSKVTNFSNMFDESSNLTDASAINDWNINSTANFKYMFGGAATHPEFTKVQGTWNSAGTFKPSI